MARLPRKHSINGFYHIVTRGVGKMIIFEDDMDYRKYISLLFRFTDECGINIIAYCLMDNHVHLLLEDKEDNLSLFMKKVQVAYSYYFNAKYQRVGHLFQGRFVSVCIEDTISFMNVYRYIINNPVKAFSCGYDKYPWSSYRDYQSPFPKTEVSLIKDLFPDLQTLNSFLDASYEGDELIFENEKLFAREGAARQIISELIDSFNGRSFGDLNKRERDHTIKMLKDNGFSVREIERLTGIGRGVIQRIG